LLLDEVTANLDPIAEQMVFETIQELARERTVMVATRRLGHLEWADTILVREAGRIVERGAHDVLLRSGGMYRRLLSMQEDL
jgi:ABC-type multidrug transport system fused ATPase/permease subunit